MSIAEYFNLIKFLKKSLLVNNFRSAVNVWKFILTSYKTYDILLVVQDHNIRGACNDYKIKEAIE